MRVRVADFAACLQMCCLGLTERGLLTELPAVIRTSRVTLPSSQPPTPFLACAKQCPVLT
eukprot:1760380-Rhodomonas_salina.3